MRARVVALAAVLLVSGCGGGPPPDAATSRVLVEKVVLDWHRFQAAGDGEAGCRLLTDQTQAATVTSDRKLAAATGTHPADSCAEAIAKYAGFSARFREALHNTQVDAVRVDGERATASVDSSAVLNGITRQIPPSNIQLHWDGDHWLIG